MIVGLHNVVEAVSSYKREVLSSDGGLWLLAMDGLLLIPLVMAAFFYPVPALIGIAVAIAVSVLAFLLVRRLHHVGSPPPRV